MTELPGTRKGKNARPQIYFQPVKNRLRKMQLCPLSAYMDLMPNYSKIERIVDKHGLTMREFCKNCGFEDSTWRRWKRGEVSPNVSTLNKLYAELDKIKKKASEAA